MLKANRTYLLLLLIFAFSFIYRLTLMLLAGFPPGADIGLHNSVIYSITGSGNVNFFWNNYHMGSGISLTFPGYHIFTSSIILLTGLPEYVAQAAVVSLFSSLIVLAAFLVTRHVWSETAGFIVAFLAAISRFDVEMLMWGGYPNVITLLLIPLTFYLYLQKDRFSKTPFLVSTSILAGSIFLTHSLSAAVFVAIIAFTALFILVKPKMFASTRKTAGYWILPIVLGALLFLPFIIQAVPAYLNANAYLNSSAQDPVSSNAIKLATISTRMLPIEFVLPLFGVLAGFLVFSKRYLGRFLTLPTLLLCMWLFVPLIMSQSYLVGFPIDYNRFLYFLILPLIIFIGVLIEHGAIFFGQVAETYQSASKTAQRIRESANKKLVQVSAALTRKNIYICTIIFLLLFSFLALPIFMGPIYNGGQTIQSFYQVMDNPGWEALQWIKANTPTNAVFVSDAYYGWWLGGFAQRRTYSAVDPQYLSISQEYNKTYFARNLIDTDYLIDNGYLQVREDGGYLSRHNPEFLTHIKNNYFPYDFFNFDNQQTIVSLENAGKQELFNLSSVPLTDMHLESTPNSESIVVAYGNDLFNFTQTVTVYAALNQPETQMMQHFATVTQNIQTNNPAVTLNDLILSMPTKGTNAPIISNDYSYVGLVDTGMKSIGELVFPNMQSRPYVSYPGKTQFSPISVYFTLGSKNNELSYSVGTYQYTDKEAQTYTFEDLIKANADKYINELQTNVPPPKAGTDFYVFDYKQAIADWNVSYIVMRNFSQNPNFELNSKFADDPAFNLVFINSEVAIFQVKG